MSKWPIKKLGDILEKIPASPKLQKKEILSAGKFPVLDQSQNIIAGYSDDDQNLYPGDLPVIIFGDHTLIIKFVDFLFVRGADGTQIIKPKKNLDEKFLYYQLLARPLHSRGYARHYGQLKNLEILIPPLEIQKKIVERLDAIKKAQELNDLQISKTDELFRSILETESRRYETELVSLGSVCEIDRGGSPRPIHKFITKDSVGMNWIKIGDVDQSERFIERTKEKITLEGVKKSRKVFPGDFILSNSMSFGRPYILKIEGCIHDGWLRLKPEKKMVAQDYLYYILLADSTRQQFERSAVGGVVRNLNSDLVRKVTIPLPLITEQQKIVTKLNAIQAYKNLLLKQKKLLQELFDSVLNKSMNEEI